MLVLARAAFVLLACFLVPASARADYHYPVENCSTYLEGAGKQCNNSKMIEYGRDVGNDGFCGKHIDFASRINGGGMPGNLNTMGAGLAKLNGSDCAELVVIIEGVIGQKLPPAGPASQDPDAKSSTPNASPAYAVYV